MVLKGFGSGDRFPTAVPQTPGPGAYDPKHDVGFKADPKSGFLTGERFGEEEFAGGTSTSELSPPRERKKPEASQGGSRSFSWATQRIHELTQDLERATLKLKEADKHVREHKLLSEAQAAEISALKTTCQGLQDESRELQKVQATMTGQLNEAMEAAAEGQRAQERVTALEQEVAEHVKVVRELSAWRTEAEEQQAAIMHKTESQAQELAAAAAQASQLSLQLQQWQQAAQEAQQQVADREARVQALGRVVAAHEGTIEAQQGEAAKQALALESLASQLSASQSATCQAQSLAATKEESVNTLSQQLAAQLQAVVRLQDSEATLNQQLREQQEQLASSQAEHQAQLEEQRGQLVASQAEHQAQLAAQQEQLAASQAEHQAQLAAQQEQLAASQAEHQAQLQEARAAHKAEVVALTVQVAEGQAVHQAEAAQLKTSHQAELAAATGRHQAELAAATGRHQAELDALVGQLAEHKALYQAELAGAKAAHQAELAALAGQLAKAKAAHQTELAGAKGSHEAQLAAASDSHQAELAVLAGQLADAKALHQSEQAALAGRLAAATAQLEQQHAAAAQLQSSLDQTLDQLQAEQSKVTALEQRVEEERERAREELAQAGERACKELAGERERARQELERERERAREELSRQAAEAAAQVQEQVVPLQAAVSDSQAEVARLTGLIKSKDSTIATHSVSADKLQQMVSELEARGRERSLGLERATSQARLAEERHCLLEGALQATRMEADQLTRQLNDRAEDEQALRAQLAACQAELALALEAHAEVQAQLDDVQDEARVLQMRLLEENGATCQLRVELQSTKSMLETACQESENMHEDLLHRQAERDQATSALEHAQIQLHAALALEAEVGAAYDKLSAAEERAELAEGEVEQLRQEVAQLQAQLPSADAGEKMAEQMAMANRRVAAAEQDARRWRAEGEAASTQLLEMGRLQEENAVLSRTQARLEEGMRELMGSSSSQGALGHNNTKQKIQYHLRLKQELEEMRAECTVLLREKFSLEQCVRYLAVRSRMTGAAAEPNAMGTRERKVTDRLMPMALAQSPMFSTPIGQRSMRLAARARGSDVGTVYGPQGSKEVFEAAINSAYRRVTQDAEAPLPAATAASVAMMGTPEPHASTPLPTIPSGGGCASEDGGTLESRILSKISSVCTPQTRARLAPSGGSAGHDGAFGTGGGGGGTGGAAQHGAAAVGGGGLLMAGGVSVGVVTVMRGTSGNGAGAAGAGGEGNGVGPRKLHNPVSTSRKFRV